MLREIEAQEERILMLEHQKERKELGLNNQGGLIMSVDNISMIKAEIEQAKQRKLDVFGRNDSEIRKATG